MNPAKTLRLPVLLFFLVLLGVGLVIFKDYGISWDEQHTRALGFRTLRCVIGLRPMPATAASADWYYGPAFSSVLAGAEGLLRAVNRRAFHLPDLTRQVWLLRHLLTFLFFFVGVGFFYRLVSDRFRDWRLGLLGCVMLVASPRIFADAFYNPKDLPFLSMSIITLFTMSRLLERATAWRALTHALACALLIDIRIVGVIAPALTVLLIAAGLTARRAARTEVGQALARTGLFVLLTSALVVLFWPALWSDPLRNFIRSLQTMSRFPWVGTVLYRGDFINANELPWHYIPIWILITTPVSYTVLFLAGCFSSLRRFFRNLTRPDREDRGNLLFLLWFFLPLVAVIVLRSVLYDGWRHMFYIYPAFVVIALVGLNSLLAAGAKARSRPVSRALRIGVPALLALDLAATATFMVRYHPFQNVFFNVLAGRNMNEIRKKFDMDYWGLSYRRLLEHILKADTGSVVRVHLAQGHGMDNALLLPPDQSKRLAWSDSLGSGTYFLSEYRGHPEDYRFPDECYAIRVGGGKVAVAYHLHAGDAEAEPGFRPTGADSGPSLPAGRD